MEKIGFKVMEGEIRSATLYLTSLKRLQDCLANRPPLGSELQRALK